jgi:hypothetical protein
MIASCQRGHTRYSKGVAPGQRFNVVPMILELLSPQSYNSKIITW